MYLRDKNFFSKLNCLANIHSEGIKKTAGANTGGQTLEKCKGMTKKPFVHPLRDSLTPADLRLRPLLGAFRTSGAVPSGLLGHPLCAI